MSVLTNLIYKFKAISIKIPAIYIVDVNKQVLKFLWRDKRPRIANTILKEKNTRINTTRLQDLLQSYSNQDSAILVKEQTNRSVEQNKESRSRPI